MLFNKYFIINIKLAVVGFLFIFTFMLQRFIFTAVMYHVFGTKYHQSHLYMGLLGFNTKFLGHQYLSIEGNLLPTKCLPKDSKENTMHNSIYNQLWFLLLIEVSWSLFISS